jgi:hypothetical protein
VRRTPGCPARAVREAIARDGEQPWHEGTPRIVRGAYGVHRKQNVLHKIVNILSSRASRTPTHEAMNPRCDRVQQLHVRCGIARLRRSHELRQAIVGRAAIGHGRASEPSSSIAERDT